MKKDAIHLSLATVLTLLALCWPARAQNQSTAAGHWEGSIELPNAKLEITVDLLAKDNNRKGMISIPSQGLSDFSLANVTVKGPDVSFEMPGIPGEPTFKGKLSEDGKVISGTLAQAGQSFPFRLERKGEAKTGPAWQEAYGPTPEKGVPGQGLEGMWQGALDIGGQTLRLVLKVTKAADGTFAATLDSPDQSAKDLQLDAVTLKDKSLHFEMKRIQAVYEGTLGKDGSEITGEWQQGAASLPLTFKRLAKKTEAK
ncbi:MAG TPA: hypothetical protein VFD58_37310 [Blastocatellia bacterium]|nr:hypothetical protein [Blastocatellia bacterium]